VSDGLERSPWPRSALVAWTLGVVATGVVVSARMLGDFDLPWHLAFGRLIASAKSIPRVDALAYTHRPIEYAEFVADLLLYGLMRLAGPLGLQVLGGLLTMLVLWVLSRKLRTGPAGLLVAASAVAAAGAWFIVRPATLSFVLIAWTAVALEIHRSHPLSRSGRATLASLVPVHLLWANLHGFVVVGVTMVVAYLMHRVACAAGRGRLPRLLPTMDATALRWTSGVAIGVLGASMVNLAGPKLLLGPLRALPDVGRVTEWEPTSLGFLLHHEPVALVYAIVVVALLVFGREPASKARTPSTWDVGVALMGLVLASSAVRLVAVAAILTAPMAARRLAGLLPSTPRAWLTSSLAPVLLALWMLMRPGTTFGVGFEPDHFPEPAVQFVRDHKVAGPMWNSSVYGGYLSWRLYPEHRVLIDGRTGWVHEPRVVALASRSEREPDAFRALDREFGFQWAICRAFEGEVFGLPLAADAAWTMVFWDDVSAVYVRRNGVNREMAAYGYRLLRHLTPLSEVLNWARRGHRIVDLGHDARLAVEQAPTSARAAFLEACAALARRDAGGFAEAVERVRALSLSTGPVRALSEAWERR
jgi:hypothetical protein